MDEKETKNGITAVLPAAGISAPEPPSAPAAETPPESLPESPVLPAPADAPAPEETAAAGDPPPAPPAPVGSAASPSLSPAELADLRASYPDADPEQDMNDPVFRGLVCGEIKLTLRQVYELFHRDRLTAAAVGNAVSDALAREIPPAVETAVAAAEQRLLDDIRLHGARPIENGVSPPCAVSSHPSVDRLTRSERAQLARRAEHGERIRL